ncbi:vesicle-associated membrane protein 5-like [Falco naumanni]|uniref:vesicle-associated membrane protein 5-like n=1 Tax=Falco naumanni TaxID=148594 RepID=UPI001ADEB6B0|nr:vesicle-associated membrane protein 5-like [Falco naumanni]
MAGLARCQREAEEVTELMRQNFARALERDGHLSQLDSRAQELRSMGATFTRSTRAVARQQRRGHRRWRVALVAIGLGTLLLLLLAIGLALWLARAPPPPLTAAAPPGHPPVGTQPPAPQGARRALGTPRGDGAPGSASGRPGNDNPGDLLWADPTVTAAG